MKYNWIFDENSFECDKSLDALTNVVRVIHWKYGNSEVFVPGCNAFAAPDPNNFTPFESLTEEQVSTWLQSANKMDLLDAAVDNEIAQKIARDNKEVLPPPF